MKLYELISGIPIVLTNEEKSFVDKYPTARLSSLDDHDLWLAQNLVRKGLYSISNDNNTLKRL
jgi:hypothetical protein